jgi:nucleoside-diphosphate-sugar epimerase
MQSERRALVTGATGFIGSAVTRALLSAGWQVTALVKPGADVGGLDPYTVKRVGRRAERGRHAAGNLWLHIGIPCCRAISILGP